MIHARPFGLLCSEAMSVHARLVKFNPSVPRVQLVCTRCMWTVESITLDHHVVSQNDKLSERCTVGENTILSWNFSEGSPYNATVGLSKIRCIKGLTSHAIHKWHDMAIILCFLISITKAPAWSSSLPAPHHDIHHHDLHHCAAIEVVVLSMLLLLKLQPSNIVNASANTNVSLKTTLWLLSVAVASTCKSILTITTWSSHTSNISHHIVGHITSQAYPAKTS